ncbi:hypothetical protein [Kutzneria sp. 744]|uniref:hypothetical protein n=1 Tax=Kutzneria sp. (strain 744) TaxID=345341 RepID=UPI0003EEC152|nr:hypothetical protein [Kutzneria sp. 744]EWM19850.1 hypothetical protein KUTG_10154 [Kutzneria sp. 744]
MTSVIGTDGTPAASRAGSIGPSEAMIIGCVLAGWGNPLSCADMSLERAKRIVACTLAEHTHDEVLRWHTRAAPPEWTIRWRWAAEATKRLYGGDLDTSALPSEFDPAAGEVPTV